ncbi:DUF5675 family protein [Porticoccaceae bacterium]|nr:DUF5675 family protein [Porticoccaceae bacterium]
MKLLRFAYTKTATIGRLEHDGEFYYTIERPWLDNQANVSCIPEGIYTMGRHRSGKFNNPEIYAGDSWEIKDVPDRTYILIHVANRSDDVLGCIGLGNTVYPNLDGVGSSRDAVSAFYKKTRALDSLEIEILSGVLVG